MPLSREEKARQAQEAYEREGSHKAAARKLGIAKSTLQEWLHLNDRPPLDPVGEGYEVKGVSTLVGEDGETKAQWIKTNREEQDRYEAFLAGIQGALGRFEGKSPRTPAPRKVQSDRLTVYPAADLHLGAYAWGEECGTDYDSDIAQALIGEAMRRLVETAPPTEECLVLDLGDLVHADNPSNETERSGAKLDVDTRWQRVAEIAALVLIHCIEEAKKKHKTVRVRKAFGNHDPNTSRMLNITLKLFYSKDKRVIVEDSPKAFWYYRFGAVLLGVTHGDKTKPQDLPSIMAADVPEDWGASRCRMWLTGHIHHLTRKEYPGCVVETFRTLAAKDAYHAHNGFRSERDMQMLVFDARGKLRERHHIDFDDVDIEGAA